MCANCMAFCSCHLINCRRQSYWQIIGLFVAARTTQEHSQNRTHASYQAPCRVSTVGRAMCDQDNKELVKPSDSLFIPFSPNSRSCPANHSPTFWIPSSSKRTNFDQQKATPDPQSLYPSESYPKIAFPFGYTGNFPVSSSTEDVNDFRQAPSTSAMTTTSTSSKSKSVKAATHVKKPLNAFMLYMKEMRAKVVAECTMKESAAINQILGRKWHALAREEQAKFYEMARKEKEIHQRLYPGWSARDNYAFHAKRRKSRCRYRSFGMNEFTKQEDLEREDVGNKINDFIFSADVRDTDRGFQRSPLTFGDQLQALPANIRQPESKSLPYLNLMDQQSFINCSSPFSCAAATG